MTRKRAVMVAALLILLGGGVGYFLLRGGDGAGGIRISGNIEATTVEVSFRIPGRIAERAVDEGMTVAAGQLVARLDNTDLADEARAREAELSAADAALRELTAGARPQEIARAEAQLADLLAGARPQEIASARAAVERARADAEKARKDTSGPRRSSRGS